MVPCVTLLCFNSVKLRGAPYVRWRASSRSAPGSYGNYPYAGLCERWLELTSSFTHISRLRELSCWAAGYLSSAFLLGSWSGICRRELGENWFSFGITTLLGLHCLIGVLHHKEGHYGVLIFLDRENVVQVSVLINAKASSM